MLKIGDYNTLKIIKTSEFGVFLDGLNQGEILLPKRYIPEDKRLFDDIEVFIYTDSEDRLIATTEKPYAKVGEFAFLKLLNQNQYGAFFDWGLSKDLFVPFREQLRGMKEGKHYPLYIYLDEKSNRIAASARIDNFISKEKPNYEKNEEVIILITKITDIGFKAVINNSHYGILYKNEVFTNLHLGDKITAFIKNIRDDEKIDLTLKKPNTNEVSITSEVIMKKLKLHNGFLPFNDKSSPDVIYKEFHISKKTFKKAIGILYKNQKINILTNGIELIKD